MEVMSTGQEAFFRPFFQRLESLGGKYCVLHSYERLPYSADNDVDIAVHDLDVRVVERMLCELCNDIGWSITQRLWYDIPQCFYYVIGTDNPEPVNVKIDLMFDSEGLGYTAFSTGFLTENPVREHGVLHCNATTEFCYKLTKRIVKGNFNSSDPGSLVALFKDSLRETVERELTRQFGTGGARAILSHFDGSGDFSDLICRRSRLAACQRRQTRYSSIGRLMSRAVWQIRRGLDRIRRPCGLVVMVPETAARALHDLSEQLPITTRHAFRRISVVRSAGFVHRFRCLSTSVLLLAGNKSIESGVVVCAGLFDGGNRRDGGLRLTRSGLIDADAVAAIHSAIQEHLRSRTRERICGESFQSGTA